MLHRRVGEALEHRDGADPLELAHHFWQAEPAGTADKALEYAIRAADHAMDRLAYEQAEEQFRRTLELVARLPEGADRSRLELELQTRLWLLLAPLRGYAHPEAGRVAGRARELCREMGSRASSCGRCGGCGRSTSSGRSSARPTTTAASSWRRRIRC